MKKLICFISTLVVFILCFMSCDMADNETGFDPHLKCDKYENYAVFTFENYAKGSTTSFELDRLVNGEGAIHYQVNLVTGNLSIKYKDSGFFNQQHELGKFSVDDVMPINGIGGYVEGKKITITFESNSCINGYVIIAFNKEALKSSDFYQDICTELQTLDAFVSYDYRLIAENKVTPLLNGNSQWFNFSDYGIDELVAGDVLSITYTGEYEVKEVYPGIVNASKMNIKSIEVLKADIVEFAVINVPGSDELSLVPVDSKYSSNIISHIDGYVVSKDGFYKKFNQYPQGTTIYASLPTITGSVQVFALYDYNPREEHIIPTRQFEITIIDHDNGIIDEISNNEGMYTPGMILEFFFHPIMDVDLSMYVNGEFYKIQENIKINDEYVWKFSFVMPADDVIIEFKTSSIKYHDLYNILNIPNISIDDIVEVRYEHGHIGVAPGSLIDIKYSTNNKDITAVLSLLDMPVHEDKSNNWQIDGGGYVEYSIITRDNTYIIEITNNYISINKTHYKFLGKYITFEYESIEAHSYVTYVDTFEVYTIGGIKLGESKGLSDYKFVEYPYDTIQDNSDLGYIETEFGRLYIHSYDVFYIKEDNVHTYYLIIGDKTFFDLFVIE